jgi:hypothetical protein
MNQTDRQRRHPRRHQRRHPEGSLTTRGISGSRVALVPEIPQVAKAPIGMTCVKLPREAV